MPIHSKLPIACLLTALLASLGCGGGDTGGLSGSHPSGTTNPTSGAVKVFPDSVTTGIDDTGARFTAPIALQSGTNVTWSSSDPSIATVSAANGGATVSAVKAGTVTITATSGTSSATVAVTVESLTNKADGQAAYTRLGCGGCHEAPGGSDITCSGIGKHTDLQIQLAATQGANPEGGDISIGKQNHSFAIAASDPAYAGIVAYLRSLPAKGMPKSD